MSRKHILSICALVGAVGACSDAGQIPVSTPVDAPARVLYPVIDDGQPTYYESQVTLSGSGGLPGWSNPEESHSRTLTEINEWQYSEGGYWTVDNRFGSAEQLFDGFTQSADLDVARGLKQRSSFSHTARDGSALTSPGSQPPVDLIPNENTPAYNQVAGTALVLASAGAGMRPTVVADGQGFSPEEFRSARADRVIVTPKGKERELARLRSRFTAAGSTPDGMLEFRKERDGAEVRVQYNPGIGAVTRVTVYSGGKRQVETVRRFRREDELWVLTAVEVQRFDAQGRSAGRTVQELSHIQIR